MGSTQPRISNISHREDQSLKKAIDTRVYTHKRLLITKFKEQYTTIQIDVLKVSVICNIKFDCYEVLNIY